MVRPWGEYNKTLEGGESNAQAHEVTRLRRFCFAAKHRNFRLQSRQKPQIPRVKKAYRRLFCAEAA